MILLRCCRPLFDALMRPIVADSDSSQQLTNKRLMVQTCSALIFIFIGILVANSDRMSAATAAVVVVYLVFAAVDTSITRLHRDVAADVGSTCDCADPPCAVPVPEACIDFSLSTFLFLTDFFLTQGFAKSMRQQMRVVQQAVGVTAAIAQLLSMYEVEEGRALLEGEDSDKLPADLKDALHRLLNNLHEYKPFLPEAILVREGVTLSTAEPPGLGQEEPKATVVFTDIQSSTELWEWSPQGMHTALQTHNDCVRRIAEEKGGYEVKVIGDAFMLAFKTVEDGCRFAIDAQVALAESKWPAEILQHPLCKPAQGQSGRMLWCGPRVRIGVHCGAVRVEKNPVTGRCDYFGPAVNTAARVEACLRHGGLTGVTKAVMERLSPPDIASLGDPLAVRLGEMDLKGVGRVDVTVLFHRDHTEREAVLTEAAAALRTDSFASSKSATSSSARTTASCPHTAPLQRRPQAHLQRRVGTCATFRAPAGTDFAALSENAAAVLEAAEQAADMTQGVVVTTVSLLCVVVWNGPHTCADHYAQCLRATDYVRLWRHDRVAAGACSGELVYGSLSGGRKKHATVIGGCVELSAALADGAEQAAEAALVASTFGRFCETQRRTRWFADWNVHGGGRIAVWQLTDAADAEDPCDGAVEQHPPLVVVSLGGDEQVVGSPATDPFPAPPLQPSRTVVVGPGVVVD